jgi:hypothetical protein
MVDNLARRMLVSTNKSRKPLRAKKKADCNQEQNVLRETVKKYEQHGNMQRFIHNFEAVLHLT